MTLEELQAGVVLPIDKPRQWTSFQAVNKVKSVVRNIYGLKKFKIGHAGTLDPLATGLLLVCIGKATKRIAELQDGDKVYTGTMVLGATTPCFDMEQAIDARYPFEHITPTLLTTCARRFVGTIMQVPPMFSAVKIDGQRAYEYARTDDPSVTIQPKAVTVYDFEVSNYRIEENSCETVEPVAQEANRKSPHLYDRPQCVIPSGLPRVDFRIGCGKGTYIRSIARDFGQGLGSGAFLSALRRERVGDYTIEQAIGLDDVERTLKGNFS